MNQTDTSWSAAYVERDREAMLNLPCRAYKVLRYLCSRADEYGRCYPGIARIADDCGGWAVETAIKHLEVLEQSGYMIYLRRNQRDILTGRQLPNVYMVNPGYLYIAPELREETVDFWIKNGGKALSPILPRLESNQQQNQTQSTRISNQLQEPTTTTTNPAKSGDEIGIGQPPETTGGAEQTAKKNDNRKVGSKQQPKADKANVPAGGGPRNYEELQPHREALPDVREEELAHEVRDGVGMPLVVARALILKHGGDAVQRGMANRFVLRADNPGGALRYLLGLAGDAANLPDPKAQPQQTTQHQNKPVEQLPFYNPDILPDWMKNKQ